MTIKVDKGIAKPKRITPGRSPKYPWADMEVGDSFFLAVESKALASAASGRCRLYPGEKYSCRTVTENGVTGTRCWREA